MIAAAIGTPTTLYAALDEPNADIDLVLGQIADWYEERGDCWRAECLQWCRAMGKRPESFADGYCWWHESMPSVSDNSRLPNHLCWGDAAYWPTHSTMAAAFIGLAEEWQLLRESGWEPPTPPPAQNPPVAQ